MGLINTKTVKYGFACGLIKSLENQLLSKNRLERLIESNNLKEQLRILSETDFGSYLSNSANIIAIEEGLERYLVDFYREITKLTNEPLLSLFFRTKRDFHNLKIAIKEKLGASFLNSAYKEAGTISAETISSAVKSGDYSKIPNFIDCVEKALEQYEVENDLWVVENEIDKCYFARLNEISAGLKNRFIKKLVRIMIDLANIKTVMRFKKWNLDSSKLFSAVTNGGFLKKSQVLKLYMQSFNLLTDAFARKGYSDIIEACLKGEDINLEEIDVNIDNHIMDYVKESHYIPVGLEPIVSYIMAKELEVKSLRIVFSGTYNQLDPVEVVKNIRELYA